MSTACQQCFNDMLTISHTIEISTIYQRHVNDMSTMSQQNVNDISTTCQQYVNNAHFKIFSDVSKHFLTKNHYLQVTI